MVNPSMSRCTAPLLVSVGLALAASASPLVAQRSATIARGARASANDSSEMKLRRLERSIDSLVRIFDEEELSPDRRSRLSQQIDERFAQFTALRMATSAKSKESNVFIRPAPEFGFESHFGNSATTILPRLAQAGLVPGWIGVVLCCTPTQIRVQDNEMFLRYLIYPEIASVDQSSPAQRAGLSPGDTLMAYNCLDVRRDEISMTRLLVPNATVKVRVRRDGKVKELPVVVAEPPARIKLRRENEMRDGGAPMIAMPPAPMIPRTPAAPGATVPRAYFPEPPAGRTMRSMPAIASLPPVFGVTPSGVAGAQVVTVSESMKRSLGLPAGVLVTTVPVGSPAEESGLEEGDVILRVGQQPVTIVRELRELIARAAENGERSVPLELRRGKDRRTITLRWRSN
jgi:membrane-associated protease RseP (regulator of RpoE activity)